MRQSVPGRQSSVLVDLLLVTVDSNTKSSPQSIYETVNEVASMADPSPPNPLTPEIQSPPITDSLLPFSTASVDSLRRQQLQPPQKQSRCDLESPWWGDGSLENPEATASNKQRHFSIASSSTSSNIGPHSCPKFMATMSNSARASLDQRVPCPPLRENQKVNPLPPEIA
ncbi:hypothetical protein Aperf_G00000070672 [Anoplocephala perfoliata]